MTKCNNCKHYFITFDAKAPKGCKAYNIKSAQLPSQIVKMASGQECMGFSEKPKRAEKKDYNDSKYW